MKKNKTIFLGKSGTGKSYQALTKALKNKGTTVIVNASCNKDNYVSDFPILKEFEDKDYRRTFHIKKGSHYYIWQKDSHNSYGSDFTTSLIFGCDYGKLEKDKKAMVLYDDAAWTYSNNNAITLWQLSHVDCNIIITADELCDILKVNPQDITHAMFKDILKYWNIIELHIKKR